MKRLLGALIALALLSACVTTPPPGWDSSASPPTTGEEDETALVRVDDHTITRRELDAYVKFFYMTDPVQRELERLLPMEREQFYAEKRKDALQKLIDRRLLLGEAERKYLSAPGMEEVLDSLVQKRVRATVDQMGSMLALHRWLRRHGITNKEWRDLIAQSILIQNYTGDEIDARVHVTPREIHDYYEANPESFRQPRRVVYRVILVDPEGCGTRPEEWAKAKTILEQIRNGADFGAMADQHSLDRATRPGGLRVKETAEDAGEWMPPLCEELLPGGVSDVQVTDAGCCIAKLERIEPSRVLPFEEVAPQARQTTIELKKEQVQNDIVSKLRTKAHIYYHPAAAPLRP